MRFRKWFLTILRPVSSIRVGSHATADENFLDAISDAVWQELMEDGEVVPVEVRHREQ